MKALVNCDIFTGDEFITDKALLIKDKLIHSFVSRDDLPNDVEIFDLDGQTVAPGFIDLQVNGGGGILFNDQPNLGSVEKIVEAHRKFGTTNLLPTFITGSLGGMIEASDAVNSYIKKESGAVLGIHFEGPFLEMAKAGVHDKSFIRNVTQDEIDTIINSPIGKVLLTICPNNISPEHLKQFNQSGVLLSIGHTNATYTDCISAAENGVTGITHLFNAMSQLQSREPGVVGAAFDLEKVSSGIIVDGHHVDFSSVRIAWKSIKRGNLFLVTDAMPPVGAKNCEFVIGPHTIKLENGKCVTKDGVLGGSALDMSTAVRNCIQKVGIPKSEALRMASLYPAKFIGLDDKYGKIKIGRLANLAIFDNEINVSGTFLEGKYESSEH